MFWIHVTPRMKESIVLSLALICPQLHLDRTLYRGPLLPSCVMLTNSDYMKHQDQPVSLLTDLSGELLYNYHEWPACIK